MRRPYSGMSFPSLFFNKQGKEIQASVKLLILEIDQDVAEKRKAIEEICERRELDIKDVRSAKTGRAFKDAVESYSTALGNAPQRGNRNTPASSLNLLEQDIADLQRLANEAEELFLERGNYAMIAQHLDPGTSYRLTYDELSLLGFHGE